MPYSTKPVFSFLDITQDAVAHGEKNTTSSKRKRKNIANSAKKKLESPLSSFFLILFGVGGEKVT